MVSFPWRENLNVLGMFPRSTFSPIRVLIRHNRFLCVFGGIDMLEELVMVSGAFWQKILAERLTKGT